VRRLFERYVAGDGGLATLAKELNGEGVPPPRGHRHGWAPSCVRAILHRDLYRGVVVWNKTRKRDDSGQRFKGRQPKRPASEIVTRPMPELRTRVFNAPLADMLHGELCADLEQNEANAR
jgi:hypothetical protein